MTFADLCLLPEGIQTTPRNFCNTNLANLDTPGERQKVICCVIGIDPQPHRPLQVFYGYFLLWGRKLVLIALFNTQFTQQLIMWNHQNILQPHIRKKTTTQECFLNLWRTRGVLYAHHTVLNLASPAGGKWHCCLHPLIFGIPVVTQAAKACLQLLVFGNNEGGFNARGWNRQWQNLPNDSLWSLPEKQSQ